jgi:hypothetical protein
MNGDTPEFRALLRRLRRQADEEQDSYLSELAAACASAAESYELCLQRLLHLIDHRGEHCAEGDAALTEITEQVTDAEQRLANFRELLAQYQSQNYDVT